MQITFTIVEGAMLIFLKSEVEKSCHGRGFEPMMLGLSSQAGAMTSQLDEKQKLC